MTPAPLGGSPQREHDMPCHWDACADTPSPIFGGSTGGLLRKAQVEEFYVITWEAKKEQIFEMPTGGAAIMRLGPNLLKFAKKEQCLVSAKYANGSCYQVACAPEAGPVVPTGQLIIMHSEALHLGSVRPGLDECAIQFKGARRDSSARAGLLLAVQLSSLLVGPLAAVDAKDQGMRAGFQARTRLPKAPRQLTASRIIMCPS